MAVLDLEAVRDWFISEFKPIDGDTVASVLALTFDASLIGETWVVTDGDEETYTGTVDATLTAEVKLRQLEKTYTITCGLCYASIEIGMYFMPFELSLIPPVFIEYIQASGTQYINTGHICSNNTKVIMRCNVPSTLPSSGSQISAQHFCGVKDSDVVTSAKAFQFFLRQSGKNFGIWYGEAAIPNPPNGADATAFFDTDITVSMERGKANVTSDGGASHDYIFTPTGNVTALYPLWLLACNTGGNVNPVQLTCMKVYSCNIYEGNDLIMELVPAKDENEAACLYDKKTGRYLKNIGSGSFIAGPEITP